MLKNLVKKRIKSHLKRENNKCYNQLEQNGEKLIKEAQILCFQCGANSIFYGDELLTTSNPSFQSDRKLLKEVGVSFNKDFETCEKTLSSL